MNQMQNVIFGLVEDVGVVKKKSPKLNIFQIVKALVSSDERTRSSKFYNLVMAYYKSYISIELNIYCSIFSSVANVSSSLI